MRAWSLAWNAGEFRAPEHRADRAAAPYRKGCSPISSAQTALPPCRCLARAQIYRRVADERGWLSHGPRNARARRPPVTRSHPRSRGRGEALSSTTDVSPSSTRRKDGEPCGGIRRLRVLHTPGHTRRALLSVDEQALFTGDTLFLAAVGRPDLERRQSSRAAGARAPRVVAAPAGIASETVVLLLIRARPWRSTVGPSRDARDPGADVAPARDRGTFVQQTSPGSANTAEPSPHCRPERSRHVA